MGEKNSDELTKANKELAFQNAEKESRNAELIIANKELAFQNSEKKKRATELRIVKKELAFQNFEKKKSAADLAIANRELFYQSKERKIKAADLVIANKELVFQNEQKEHRASELVIANKELKFQNIEKENLAAELIVANKELKFQNEEKEYRAAELIIANKELAFQNEEKEHRAAELIIANKELAFQNEEKEHRAMELIIANKELIFQNAEKEQRAAELAVLSGNLTNQQAELEAAHLKLKEKAQLLVKQEEQLRTVNADLVLLNLELEGRVMSRTVALAESESRFRNMMETIPQIAWTNTFDGEVTFYNQQWYSFSGLDAHHTKAWSWRTIIHPEDLHYTYREYLKIRETNAGGEFQIRCRRADGLYRWHLSRLMPIKNERGGVELWVGTATDIHELKMLQQQKDDFISIASHELRTPITSLKTYLQLLDRIKETPTHPMLPGLVEKSNKSIDRLTVLIEDLLSASSVNEGQIPLHTRRLNLVKIISDSCNYLLIDNIYKVDIEGDVNVEIEADAERINQVLVNLLNNAIKYAPESKKIRITIKKTGDRVRVSVIDFGDGIAPNIIPNLFQRYYRAATPGTLSSGLGLGLFISAEIIKKHHGVMGVESKEGAGSTFWFSLPISQFPADADEN